MKIAAILVAGLALVGCKGAEPTDAEQSGASAEKRKRQSARGDAGSGPATADGDDSNGASDDDEASGDGTSDDDAPPRETGGEGADDDVASEDPEPDLVDFGGGGVEVSVEEEPGNEPAPDPADEPADEPEPEPEPLDEPAEPPLVSCDGVAGTGDGVLIDDLEDTDLDTLWQDERAGSWFWYDDGSDGTHALIIDPPSDGPAGSGHAIHVSGGGFTEWGSGFGVGLRWDGPSGERCVYDASYYTGIRFWVLGNGAPMRLIATNPSIIPVQDGGSCDGDDCWDNHGIDLETPLEWTLVSVPFAELAQRWTEPPLDFDATRIFTLEFTLDAGVDYDVWIDDIGFYREGEELPAYGSSEDSTTE